MNPMANLHVGKDTIVRSQMAVTYKRGIDKQIKNRVNQAYVLLIIFNLISITLSFRLTAVVESGLNLYDRYKVGSLEKATSYDEFVCIEEGRLEEDNLEDQKVLLQNVRETIQGFMLALALSLVTFFIEPWTRLRQANQG